MHWLWVAVVGVACTPNPPRRPAAMAPVDAAVPVVDAAANDAEPVVDVEPVSAPTFAAKQAPRACPESPEGIESWADELFPGCASQPFQDVMRLVEAPNVCDGPCPPPCRIVVGRGADQRTSKISYDTSGRWTRTSPLMNSSGISSESCTYDDAGRRASCVTDYRLAAGDTPVATTLTAKRDKKGRIIEIVDSDEDWKEPFKFKYDGAGRVRRATWELTAQQPGVTSYSYDQRGRLTSETGTTYKYNGAGQLVEQRSRDSVILYKYSENRIVEQDMTHGRMRMNGPTRSTLGLTYDAMGRLHTVGNVTFVYDCK
jgi:hypothetical protein